MKLFNKAKQAYGRTIIKAFDQWSGSYDGSVVPKLQKRGYSYRELAEQIVEGLSISQNSHVAELGCGSGVLGKEIRQISNSVIDGADISPGMLQQAKKKRIYNLLINASAEDLPFSKEGLDAVYSAFMFHSVLDQSTALQEIHRVLKPGGRAVLVDLCPKPAGLSILTFLKGIVHSYKYEFGALSRYNTVHQLSKMIKKGKFNLTGVTQLGEEREYMHYLLNFQKPK